MMMQRIPNSYRLRVDGTEGLVWSFTPPLDWELTRIDGSCLAFFNIGFADVGVSAGSWNGVVYIHASLVRLVGMPSYEDMVMLKESVFGPDRYAAQIFPSRDEHVNIHSRCLHLWGPIDPDHWPLPKFGEGGTI